MTSENGSKINKLLKLWPHGSVAVSSWLEKQGIYQQLAYEYEKTSWLKRIGQGAFIKAGDQVTWTGGLYALQTQLGLEIHAGGKTALEMQGYGHFIPLGKGSTIYLFGKPNQKLLSWFKNYDWGCAIHYKMVLFFSGNQRVGMTQKQIGMFEIRISSLERAIMEVLYFVPHEQSFEEAKLLMEGLNGLRPKLVQELLERCHSIKVKRLFMLLAEECNHPWIKKLNLSKVNFGKGQRSLIKGGHFNAKYKISVPEVPKT